MFAASFVIEKKLNDLDLGDAQIEWDVFIL